MAPLSRVDTTENASGSGWRRGELAPAIACRRRRSGRDARGFEGTLRLALERLESNGEIVRRQGSGTFVGRVALARRSARASRLSSRCLARAPPGKAALRAQSADPAGAYSGIRGRGARDPRWRQRTLIQRTVLADGTVAAHMRDVVDPQVQLPPAEELCSRPRRGQDGARRPDRAWAADRIREDPGPPVAVEPGGRLGKALGTTASPPRCSWSSSCTSRAARLCSTRSRSSLRARSICMRPRAAARARTAPRHPAADVSRPPEGAHRPDRPAP